MFRIRFHGRGGQGMKTASRILGTAFFFEGFEVQDAPLYGAERRGAPVFAYVRAGRETINERGIIKVPDLVVVADDTLVPPEGAISVNKEGFPEIDYKHCKGCMICAAQCPPHAISAEPEHGKEGEKG
jgi:2-oxoacid:acceptor oxidoreductase gamma subunit (pyruvate/2-ketoisovalerate family)